MKNPAEPGRILLVTPHTVPDYSGSGINAFHFARFLNRENLKATILTFNRNLKLARCECRDGVIIRRIPYFNYNFFSKILSLTLILPAYIFYVSRTRVLFIYGAHIIGYQALICLGRMFGKKVLFRSLLLGSDDAGTIFRKTNRILHPHYRKMFRCLDLYFAINPVFAERFVNHVGKEDNVLICPQGVDTEAFYPGDEEEGMILREKHGFLPDTFLILSVGFLINRKGFKEVFSILREFDQDFRYCIIGEYEFRKGHFLYGKKEEAQSIRKDGESLLGKKLILAGPVDEMAGYYQMADLVLINSSREGLPNNLLEALACGKTVLVRDLPGIRYIVEHQKNGIVYQDGSQLKEWLKKLYSKPGLRKELGHNARRFIQESANFNLTWERMKTRL